MLTYIYIYTHILYIHIRTCQSFNKWISPYSRSSKVTFLYVCMHIPHTGAVLSAEPAPHASKEPLRVSSPTIYNTKINVITNPNTLPKVNYRWALKLLLWLLALFLFTYSIKFLLWYGVISKLTHTTASLYTYINILLYICTYIYHKYLYTRMYNTPNICTKNAHTIFLQASFYTRATCCFRA